MIILLQTIAGNATASLTAVLPYVPYAIGGAVLVGVALVIKRRMELRNPNLNNEGNILSRLNFMKPKNSNTQNPTMDDPLSLTNQLIPPANKGIIPQASTMPATEMKIKEGYDILIIKKVTAERVKALAIINQKNVDTIISEWLENYLAVRASKKNGNTGQAPPPQKQTAISSIGDYLKGKSQEFSNNEGFFKQ